MTGFVCLSEKLGGRATLYGAKAFQYCHITTQDVLNS